MRRILLGMLILLAAGCSSAPKTTPQPFQVSDQSIEFAPPPPEWKQVPGKDQAGKVVAIIFDHPSGDGQLAVTTMDGVKQLDKDILQRLADGVFKRSGQIVKQDYVSVAGGQENAYRMEFSVDSGKQAGVQVHFVEGNHLWSIVMTVPAKELSNSRPVFDRVVSTLQLKSAK